MMCFLSVDLRLQMLMERSLLAIVSLMVFQIFEALYINCELGSGVIRKASFLFDSKYKEYIQCIRQFFIMFSNNISSILGPLLVFKEILMMM